MSGLRRQIGDRNHGLPPRQAELAKRFVAQDTLHLGPIERLMAQAAVERVLWLVQVEPADSQAAAAQRRSKRLTPASGQALPSARGLEPEPTAAAIGPESAEQQAERQAAEHRQQQIERKLENAIDRMLTEQIGRRRRPWWQRWRN